MSRCLLFGAATLLATLSFSDALADPKFEFGKADELKDVKKPEWRAAVEAGVIFTTGNSETTTASGAFKVSRKSGDNKLSIEALAAYATSSVRSLDDKNGNGTIDNIREITSTDTVTAETFAGKVRYDRFLTAFNSLFVAALVSRDLPAGKEFVFGGQAGYSRQLVKTKTVESVGEFGYDYSREDLITGEPNSIHSARAFVGVKAVMTEGTTIDGSGELLTNLNREKLSTTDEDGTLIDGGRLKDTRFNVHLAITAKIGKNLAFQTSLDAKYDRRPAPLGVKNLAMGYVPEASSIDTIMKASLIYDFF